MLIPLQVIQIIVTEFTIFNLQNIFNRIRKHFSSYTYATICLRLSEDFVLGNIQQYSLSLHLLNITYLITES